MDLGFIEIYKNLFVILCFLKRKKEEKKNRKD